MLFVVCDSQESAMTIFNTLNSRGMPLSNADVLKGYLYKYYKERYSADLDCFIELWNEIEANIENVESNKDVNLDFLFLQYMHIIKAVHNDSNTTTIDFLDFFTSKDDKKVGSKTIKAWGSSDGWLYKDETMPFIRSLANFWLAPQDYLCGKSLNYINVLNIFQNKGWQSFVSCLVWKHRELFWDENIKKDRISQAFEAPLLELLKKVSLLFLRLEVTSNRISHLVLKLNINILQNENPSKKIDEIPYPSFETFKENMWEDRANKAKYLLYLYAYVYDNFSQPIDISGLEVEHILPKQWQNANFNGWDEESHKEYLEQIGNKILLPKKTNIKCADNFFAKKKEIYSKDARTKHLKEVQELAKLPQNGWLKEDIDNRNRAIYHRLESFFKENIDK
ncbi:HNH endonuclease family protein [Helicobacter mustelae]|uniref:HNH endonuclease family protein n=2 Tax=Helicobacter mustelae TaxID=217 RepID=UPI00030A7FC9|nr:HNH endonuclease family protein [Helicobacter mustelae]